MSAGEAGGCGRRRRGAGRGGGAGRQRDAPAASRAHLGRPTSAHGHERAGWPRILHRHCLPHARAHVRTYTSTDRPRADTLTGKLRAHAPHTHGLLAPPGTNCETARRSQLLPTPLPPAARAAPAAPTPSLSPSFPPESPGPGHPPSCHGDAGSLPGSAEHPHAPPPQGCGGGSRPSAPASVGAGPEGWGLEVRRDPGSRQARRSDPPAVAGPGSWGPEPRWGVPVRGCGLPAASPGLLRCLCGDPVHPQGASLSQGRRPLWKRTALARPSTRASSVRRGLGFAANPQSAAVFPQPAASLT